MNMKVVCVVCVLAAVCLVTEGQAQNDPPTSVWTPGRITQVTLAVLESALLTLILVFPGVMDPIVAFINTHVGSSGSRRRREVQSVVTQQASAFHNLFLDAVDLFEDMDAALTLES